METIRKTSKVFNLTKGKHIILSGRNLLKDILVDNQSNDKIDLKTGDLTIFTLSKKEKFFVSYVDTLVLNKDLVIEILGEGQVNIVLGSFKYYGEIVREEMPEGHGGHY